jgi:hypothetical protein
VDRLKQSTIYREYERAFRDTAGLPLNLRSIEASELTHRSDPNENPFCARPVEKPMYQLMNGDLRTQGAMIPIAAQDTNQLQ